MRYTQLPRWITPLLPDVWRPSTQVHQPSQIHGLMSSAAYPCTPRTVPFHSIRTSRITVPKMYENFRTCHGSPRPCSKVAKMSRNRRKIVQKNQNFARGGFALRRQLKFDETGHREVGGRQRQLLWPFRDLQGFGKASHYGEDSGIGI